jgi:class 3 adenylate cyclase
MKKLINQLENAEGRSEFLISVVSDIRGFSQFSTVHESPDLAMFIKRFYLKLLQIYFKDVSFAKPTGDGLLMLFKYNEKTLPAVAEQVLSTCFQVLNDFPTMFNDDPMINFATPQNLGFGIARGTACCLFSKNQIIDYSGQLLNLSARLNDLARPKGIVIDGSFIESVVPSQFRLRFKRKRAYIRSIAEDFPREILCSTDVSLPPYAQNPLSTNEWILEKREILAKDLSTMSGKYNMALSHEIFSLDKTKLEINYPNMKLPGYTSYNTYTAFEYIKDAKGSRLEILVDRAKAIITENQVPPDAKIVFDFQYIPKIKSKK